MRNVGITLYLAASLMIGSAPAWADAAPVAPAPAPEAPRQIACLTPMMPFDDIAHIIFDNRGAIPAFEAVLSDTAVKTFFLAPAGGKGWAETVTDVASGNACLTAMGPSWKESEFRPVSHRPKVRRPPTIRPIDPVETF